MELEERIEEALEYIQNDADHAMELFDGILKEEPDNINAINGKASALMKLHRNKEALKAFDHSLSIEENSSAYLNRGILLKSDGDYKNAIISFDKALDCNPRLSAIVSILKNEILEAVDLESTDICSIYDFDDDTNALIRKAYTYKNQNKLWDALDCLEEAIKIEPKSRNSIEDIIKKLVLTIKKEFLYREIDSKSTKIDKLKFQTIKSIIVEDNPHKTLLLAKKIFEINENDIDALNCQGIAYFSLDEYDKSIQSFDKCLSINSNYAYASFNKGLVLRRMRLLNESLDCFNKVMDNSDFLNKTKPYQEEVLTKINN